MIDHLQSHRQLLNKSNAIWDLIQLGWPFGLWTSPFCLVLSCGNSELSWSVSESNSRVWYRVCKLHGFVIKLSYTSIYLWPTITKICDRRKTPWCQCISRLKNPHLQLEVVLHVAFSFSLSLHLSGQEKWKTDDLHEHGVSTWCCSAGKHATGR